MSDAQARTPRPRWTIGETSYTERQIYEGKPSAKNYRGRMSDKETAERIAAALNAQAPPPAEPPTSSYAQKQANETGKPYYVGPDNVTGASHWVYPHAAAPPPQPETLAADRVKRECINAICRYCAGTVEGADCEREPVRFAHADYVSNFGQVLAGDWIHPGGTTRFCEAGPIHDLDAFKMFPLAQPRTVTMEALPDALLTETEIDLCLAQYPGERVLESEQIACNFNALLAPRVSARVAAALREAAKACFKRAADMRNINYAAAQEAAICGSTVEALISAPPPAAKELK